MQEDRETRKGRLKEWLTLGTAAAILGALFKGVFESIVGAFLQWLLGDVTVAPGRQWMIETMRFMLVWFVPIALAALALSTFYLKGHKDGLEQANRGRLLPAMFDMGQLHGHIDEDGLREAWHTGKSLNAESCWICGKPRFMPSQQSAEESKND